MWVTVLVGVLIVWALLALFFISLCAMAKDENDDEG